MYLLVRIVQEAGWASELVWTQRLEEISFASAGDRPLVVQYSEVKTTQCSGNYIDLYHLLYESVTLCFAYRVYLCVSWGSGDINIDYFRKLH